MSFGSDEPKTTTQTTSSAPWSAQQPALQKVFSEALNWYNTGNTPTYYQGNTVTPLSQQTESALQLAEQRALAGSPLMGQAQGQLSQTLQGDYLGGNPAFQGAVDAASSGLLRQYNQNIVPQINASFSSAGRYGSGAQANAQGQAATGLMEQLGNINSSMAYQNYEAERGRQFGATQMAPYLAQQDYNDIAQLQQVGAARENYAQDVLAADIAKHNWEQALPTNKIATLSGLVQGGYGGTSTTTTPYFRNTSAGILSGALGGASAGAGVAGPWGAAAGGILGGLAGLFG